MKGQKVASPARRGAGHGRWKGWLLALAAAVAGAAATLFFVYVVPFAWRSESPIPAVPGLGAQGLQATLYFADPRWTRLVPEKTPLQLPAEGATRVRALIEALAQGPRQAGSPVLPKGMKLRGAYLGRNGLAVIDLDQELEGGAGGASGELLTVYALVHTVVENVPGVQSVQILVNGQERETLAGHVKISEPLRPSPEWVTPPAR